MDTMLKTIMAVVHGTTMAQQAFQERSKYDYLCLVYNSDISIRLLPMM